MAYGTQQLQALQGIQGMLASGYGPGALSQGAQGLYQDYLQSPAFYGAYNEILRGAGGLQYRMNRALRERGAPGAGVNIMARNLGQSFAQGQLGNLHQQMYMNAMQMMAQTIGQRSSALSYLGQNIRYPDPQQGERERRRIGFRRLYQCKGDQLQFRYQR